MTPTVTNAMGLNGQTDRRRTTRRNAMYVLTHLVQYAKIYKKYAQTIIEDIMNYATCE